MKFRALMFDLDGTLLNTLQDIADSVNRSLQKMGFPGHPVEAYKLFIGSGRATLALRALPSSRRDQATVDKLLDLVNQDYLEHWADNTAPYPGIAGMLDSVSKRELKLAILSNKPDEFTQQMVQKMLSRWHFDLVSGALKDVPVKPNPQLALSIATRLQVRPSQILYVGDSDVDMQMAAAAEMFSAGALWGFRTKEELISSGARVLLSHPGDILDLL
jgi:phosphoglycolate phosphatase